MPRKKKSNLGRRSRDAQRRHKKIRENAKQVCASGFIYERPDQYNRTTLVDNFVKELVIKRPFCTVCKRFQTSEEQATSNQVTDNISDSDDDYRPAQSLSNGKKWTTTSENTPVTRSPVLFRLNDILDIEFNNGNICDNCNQLVDELDAMQSHLASLKQTLSNRVDKYYNKTLTYEVEHELVAQTLEGTKTSGDIFIRKAKIVTGTDIDATLVPFPAERPFIALTRGKSLANNEVNQQQQEMQTRQDKLVPKREKLDWKAELEAAIEDSKGDPNMWKNLQWTEGRHVEKVLMTGNFDDNFKIDNRWKKALELSFKGHKYVMYLNPATKELPKDDIVNRWVCKRWGKNNGRCPATLVTSLENDFLLLDSLEAEHNHEPPKANAPPLLPRPPPVSAQTDPPVHNANMEDDKSQVLKRRADIKPAPLTSFVLEGPDEDLQLSGHTNKNFVINSIRGVETLLFQGNLYVKSQDPNDNSVNRWACKKSQGSKYRGYNCLAIVITNLRNDEILLHSLTSDHNHGVVYTDNYIFASFWGSYIMSVHWQRPELSDKELLRLLRYLFKDKTIVNSEGMVHHIHWIRARNQTKQEVVYSDQVPLNQYSMDLVEDDPFNDPIG